MKKLVTIIAIVLLVGVTVVCTTGCTSTIKHESHTATMIMENPQTGEKELVKVEHE